MQETLVFIQSILNIIYSKNNETKEQQQIVNYLSTELQAYHRSLGGSMIESFLHISLIEYTKDDFIQNKCFNNTIDYSKVKNWIELFHLQTGNVIRLFLSNDNHILACAFYTNCLNSNKESKKKISEEFMGRVDRYSVTNEITTTNYYNFLVNGEFYENQRPYHRYH